ncbi:MAG: hypothetical protein ACR2NX_03575 [Chthoniobacterales bacterium]
MILQIVPRPPGSHEGVGDYAAALAAGLERSSGFPTEFVTGAMIANENWRPPPATAVILHYVNYGYDPRGIPSWLPGRLREVPRLLTIFHELYASGSWRQSAFWLQPRQKKIARLLAEKSSVCIVSSSVLAEQLQVLAPRARVLVRPVVSTFGEPPLALDRDPRRWVICGGTELIRRSLRSFAQKDAELFVVGGADVPEVRRAVEQAHYFPNVEAAAASQVLSSCAFGWIDYFETARVPCAAILKSTAFAACCAHGVIPVLPRADSKIALGDDALPGPFSPANLPTAGERPAIAQATYDWYHRNASAAHLAATVAQAISA